MPISTSTQSTTSSGQWGLKKKRPPKHSSPPVSTSSGQQVLEKKKRPATTSSGQKVLKKKRPAKPSSSPAAISITSGQARKLNFWQHFEFCFHGNNWSQCKSGIFKQGRGTDKVYSWHFHMSCFNSTGLAEIIRTLDCLMFYQLEYPFCLFTTWYRIISLSRFGVFTLIISYFTLNILCPHVLCV